MTDIMPPPKKVLRRGTPELQDALIKGEVLLSLPNNAPTWIGRSWDGSADSPTMDLVSISQEDDKTKDVIVLEGKKSPSKTSVNATAMVVHKMDSSKDEEDEDDFKSLKTSAGTKNIVATKFSDIIGHGAVKLRLEEVLLPLALPSSLADSILTGIRSHSASILMYGPPGCGKTELAKAVAGEAEAAFLAVGPSDILSKFVGESEQSIRNLFHKAREQARQMESRSAVLFFDEIDALGQSRGGNDTSHSENNGCTRRVLAELLIQMNCINDSQGKGMDENQSAFQSDLDSVDTVYDNDEANSRVRLIVVAATNRPEDCDPALVRRFAVRVVVGLPSHRDRKRIVRRYLKGIENNISKRQLQELAAMTDGWSGSDLESLTREAAMAPVRECIRAAALLKRRRPRQQKGISTSQDGAVSVHSNSYEDEHDKILQQFRDLRSVTFEDFEEAIAFWATNHDASIPPTSRRKSMTQSHYDSSSDEEE